MLEYVLNSFQKVKILKLLVNRPEWIFSESEIARELSIPKATVHRALKALRDQNILIEFKKTGRNVVFQLNKSNYLVKKIIEPMLKKDCEIVKEKSKEFCEKLKDLVDVAIIFGSAIRGEMTPTSDVDLALISKKPKELEKLATKLKLEYLKNESLIFTTHIFTKEEFRKKYMEKNPLVLDMINGEVIKGDLDEVI
jgi:predicted nucleotidyltransferase